MSDMNLNSEPLIKPFPSILRLYYMGSYLLPVIVYCIVLVFINELSLDGLLAVLKSPAAGATIVITDFLVPTLMYNHFQKSIRMYDGSEESLRLTNKHIRNFEMFHLVWIFMNLFVSTISPILICTSMGIHVDPIAIVCAAAGSVALFGFLPMIIFVETYEELFVGITFKRREITSSFVLRNVLITGLAAIGLMTYIVAPVFVLSNEHLNAYQLFLHKVLPVSLVAIVLAVVDTTLLQTSVRIRLRPITDFMHSLSLERDYTQQTLPVKSRDEVGYLKQSVNEFYVATRELLVAMDSSIAESRRSAEVLAANMTEAASSITQITANIDSVKTRVINQSAGVEEADATIQSMVDKIRMLTASIENQYSDIESSSSAIEEMVANIRSVSDILAKNTVAVNQLTAASDTGRAKVEQAVDQAKTILEDSAGLLEASDIIQNIAEQTNLLAMNAAIEAAHAGEAGKGFAVVSDEIRKLAEQSNTQGKTISAQLESLQQSIGNITTATKEVQDQFSIIFNLADNVKNQETVVENAMQEQRAGSEQVLNAIKSMRESTRILKNGAEELESGSREVSTEMKALSQVTEEISGAMAEIANGTELIVTSSNEVNETSEENHENLNTLSEEISKFRVSKEN